MGTTRIQLDSTIPGSLLPQMETLIDGRERKKIAGRDDWAVRRGRYVGGLSAGVEVIELCNGPLSVLILPTRGMGVWKVRLQDLLVGWNAPIGRPVHPQFVNLQNRNGLGWLDGFNELICRCGLSFNGPPGHDDGARSPVESDVTLHGRIANLPAGEIELFVDDETSTIGITGVVDEATLFGPQLRLRTTVASQIGSQSFSVRDEVTNVGAEPTELELLFHCNVGRPILEAGAMLECAAQRVIPRDARAAEGIGSYATCSGPTTGYSEQVYYFDLLTDERDQSLVLLRNRAADLGVSLSFSKSQLPCFTYWKCAQDERSGYVVGIEPGTNFPNFKAFERHHGRVIRLADGETHRSELRMEVHSDSRSVARVRERIRALQGGTPVRVDPHPTAPYCPID